MTTLRINLHIRADASPRLHAALASVSPRPRAERLRGLAELGLQMETGQLHSQRADPNPIGAPNARSSAADMTETTTEGFANDLCDLLRKSGFQQK